MNTYPSHSRRAMRPGSISMLIASLGLFAAAAPVEVDEEQEPDVTSQSGAADGPATGTATGTAKKAKTAVTEQTVAEAEVNQELVALIKSYEEVKEKATSFMCDIADMIAKDNIGRPVLVKTVMEARGVTLETANSYASRLIKLSKNPDAIQALRDGTATVRETIYGKKPPGTETTADAAGSGGKTDAEKIEDKYNRLLTEFVATCKAMGLGAKDVLASVKANLADAGVK